MGSFVELLFEQVPWLKPVLAWSIALLVVVLVLTVPSYFIFLPFARRVRQELRDFIERIRDAMHLARTTREREIDDVIDRLRDQSSLKRLDASNRALLDRTLERLSHRLRLLARALERTAKSFYGINKLLTKCVDRLERVVSVGQTGFHPLPSAAELESQVERTRIAWGRLVISALLLVAIVAVNTGMLGQIIRDLGFIPATLMFLGVPLYWVFALLLTVFEAGLGFIHAATKSSPEDPNKIRAWPIIAVLLALTIATVEGFFYSQVAPSKDATVEIPLIGYQMKQANLFFLWGVALVSGLFGLGSTWYEAFETVRRGNALMALRHRLQQLKREQEHALERMEGARAAFDRARAMADETRRILDQDAPSAISARTAVQQLSEQVDSMRQDAPEWAMAQERNVSRADVDHLAAQAIMWTVASLAAGFILVFTGYETISYLLGRLPVALCVAIALAQVVVFFGAGLLYRGGEVFLMGGGSQREIVSAPILSRASAICLLTVITITYIFVILSVRIPTYQQAVWVISFLLGLFLMAAAYHFGPLLTLSRVCVKRVAGAIAAAGSWVLLAIIRCACAAIAVVEQFFYFLATPILVLRREAPAVAPGSMPAARAQVATASGDYGSSPERRA